MEKIKNFKELELNHLRRIALSALTAGLLALDTKRITKQGVKISKGSLWIKGKAFALYPEGRIFVVAVGKCALDAAWALERILGRRLTAGIAADIRPGRLKKIKAFAGSHPFPTKTNIDITARIIKLLQGLTRKDTVICVISGGGSSLLCSPRNFVCEDERDVIACLTRAGATIGEINVLRRHLSRARGGFLAKYAYPARVLSLIFSDVPGNNLMDVASGPTVRDTTTVLDALKIIRKHRLKFQCAFNESWLLETPKDPKYFSNVKNFLFFDNREALAAMKQSLMKRGFAADIATHSLQGEAKATAARILKDLRKSRPKRALLYGGEMTVIADAGGRGGRNQELALTTLGSIKKNEIIMPFASDGWDNTEHAGAICDIITLRHAKKLNLIPGDYLRNHNSFDFFRQTKDFLKTGRLGSNVSDLIIAIKN